MTLESGYELVLENTLFVPSMRRNLISVSVLDKAGYFFDIRNFILKLFFDSNLVGTGFLSDGLYRLKLNTNKDLTSLHVESSGTKRP